MAQNNSPLFFTLNCQKLRKSAMLGSCLFLGCHALANTNPNTTSFLPYTPGLSITGLSGDITTGFADALVPLAGQSTSFFYVDPQGLYHNGNDYSGAVGVGGRKLTDQFGLLGAYVFGDYNHSPAGHSFWFVSPGVERLGDVVDFSANVYIPTGSNRVSTGSAFGSELDDFDSITFAGHTEYDQLFDTFESVGVGEDAQVGFRLPIKDNPKIYFGGYHFSPKDAQDITGGVARLQVPVTSQLDIDVSEGYDNFSHNTVRVGLAYHFGGRHTAKQFDGALIERMVDPIQRNLIAVGGSSHTAQPILKQTEATGDYGVVMDHISFFLPDSPIQDSTASNPDGSYEHPYLGLNQTNVDDANAQKNINFFFNGGIGPYTSATEIDLMNDNIFGRQSYEGRLFVKPATGNNRPIFEFTNSSGNGLNWNVNLGDSDILVTSIQIEGDTNNGSSALFVQNNGTGQVSMKLDNVNISNTKFNNGVYANNDGGGGLNLVVNNSTLNANIQEGILANNSLGSFNLKVNNSTFNGNGDDGIQANNTNNSSNDTFNLIVNNSTLTDNSHDGILVNNNSGIFNLITRHSNLNENGHDGIEAHNNNAGILNLIVKGSSFNGNGRDGIEARSEGTTTGTFNLTVNNSSFNRNSHDGIEADNVTNANAIFNLTVHNSSFNGNVNDGIEINNNSAGIFNSIIRNASFNGNLHDGLEAHNNSNALLNLIIHNASFNGNGRDGIEAYNADNTFNLTVGNASFNANGHDGLEANNFTSASGTFNLTATNASFNANANDGIEANNSSAGIFNAIIRNASFNGNFHDGLEAHNNSDATFVLNATGSSFNGNHNDGIEADNNSTSTFDLIANASTFNGNMADGIQAFSSSANLFTLTANNSTFNNNGRYGIETQGINPSNVTYFGSTFSENILGPVHVEP